MNVASVVFLTVDLRANIQKYKEMYPALLPIYAAATDITAMCKHCGTHTVSPVTAIPPMLHAL